MNETTEFTGKNDPLYQHAVKLIIESKRISPSYIQRRLKISYRRAELLCHAVIESLMVSDSIKNGQLTIDAAEKMGATGAEPTEAERQLFEAWMKGHCWRVAGDWDGKGYRHQSETDGHVNYAAMATRQLWAAWRDRAALAGHVRTKDLTDRELADVIHGKGVPLGLWPEKIREYRLVIAADREINKC